MVGACNSITMSFELNWLCMLLNNYIFWVELVGWHKQLNNYVWILKWKMSKYIYSGRYIGRGPHSDRHVTVASHQPLKNFIPKKKTSEEFPAEKPRVKLLFFTNLRWTWFSTRGYHIRSSTVNQNWSSTALRKAQDWQVHLLVDGDADETRLHYPLEISFSLQPGSRKRE